MFVARIRYTRQMSSVRRVKTAVGMAVRVHRGLPGIAVACVLLAGLVAVASASSSTDRSFPASGRFAAGSRPTARRVPMFIFGTDHGIRPRNIYFSGDGGDIVVNLRWSSWTSSHAIGEGVSDIQGCVPDCAAGAEILTPTLITLRDPVDGYFTRIIERRDGQDETWHYTRKPSRGSFPQGGYEPALNGPAVSLEYYWGDIDTGAYAKAWTYLSPAVESEAAFVGAEKEARPKNIELEGTLAGISGSHATIVIDRLITHDQQHGCRSWSGHYEMIRDGGHWLIASARIAPKAC